METYKLPTVNNRPPVVSDLGFYADIRFDADDSAPVYIGLNLLTDSSDDDTNWKIYKFTYVDGKVTRIQMAYSTWTGRASAF